LARRTYLFPLFFPSIRLRVRHWFVVGTSDAKPEELTALQEESFRFGDMLLLPLTDQYQGSSGAVRYFFHLMLVHSNSLINW
jgi:hypothetical protein